MPADKKIITWLGFLLLIFLTGCSFYGSPVGFNQPQQTAIPQTQIELKSLPKPIGKITVSVYTFRDQTGQYKEPTNISSFSTAVTQGATSILVQALKLSDWFVPLEREGLQNILTERKIIRAANKDLGREDNLPPLKTASIIIEGGIIGFDSNVQTGGKGVGYYGFTLGELYRQDQVTVVLRAINVKTGQILSTVSVTKTIFSQEVRSGFFRFVSAERIGEAEMGFTYNEPVHICVVQAIQKAVINLIISGAVEGIWSFRDDAILDSKLVQDYLLYQNEVSDPTLGTTNKTAFEEEVD